MWLVVGRMSSRQARWFDKSAETPASAFRVRTGQWHRWHRNGRCGRAASRLAEAPCGGRPRCPREALARTRVTSTTVWREPPPRLPAPRHLLSTFDRPVPPDGGDSPGRLIGSPHVSRIQRLTVVLVLNLGLVAALVAVGITAHSLAVLAEGGDYLLDAAGVAVALLAIRLSARSSGRPRPPGRPAPTDLAALFNCGWLLVLE